MGLIFQFSDIRHCKCGADVPISKTHRCTDAKSTESTCTDVKMHTLEQMIRKKGLIKVSDPISWFGKLDKDVSELIFEVYDIDGGMDED